MDQLRDFIANLQDLPALIKWAGYFGLTAIVFAETGLLVGFFLPGDSLLVTAGLVSARGLLNVYVLGVLLNIAAAAGNSSVGFTSTICAGSSSGALRTKMRKASTTPPRHSQ